MGLIKKILILDIVIWIVVLFYKKFIAPVTNSFLNNRGGNVRFLEY